MANDSTITFDLHPRQAEAAESKATELLYGGAGGGGKALALDTRVPTPQGWATIGSLDVGDTVIDRSGNPCAVVGVTEVMYGRPCYEITLDDDSKFIADENHLWFVQSAKDRERAYKLTDEYRKKRKIGRKSRGKGKRQDLSLKNSTRTYEYLSPPQYQIFQTKVLFRLLLDRRGSPNWSIPISDGFRTTIPDKLELDPYVLGAWLGDGTSCSSGFSSNDLQILSEIKGAGIVVTKRAAKYSYGLRGIAQILRSLKVNNNKHIPPHYLRASYHARLALLQGLMDTDGYCGNDGSCEFDNTNKNLALDVLDLVRGLGIKCNFLVGDAKLNGRIVGKKYRVVFQTNKPVFRLERKLTRLKLPARKNSYFLIKNIKPISSVPVKCIQVNSPDGSFLIGDSYVPTHNSFLTRVLSIQWALEIPGINIFLFRRLYDDLIKNHIEGPLGYRAMLAPWLNGKSSKSPLIAGRLAEMVQGEIRFWNGSKIFLCHLQHQKDITKYYGPEFHVLFIEEATQFTEFMIRFLRSRLRMPDTIKIPEKYKGLFPRVIYTTNPGGVGHCLTHGEVLTPSGWKDIRSFSPGDPVYTVAKDRQLICSSVDQVHSSFYSGEIVEISARGFYASMTPNHKVAKIGGRRIDTNRAFSLVPFCSLPGQATILRSVTWHGTPISKFSCPIVKTRKARVSQPTELSGVQYAKLMGWFLSEGCTVSANKAFHISQIKADTRKKLKGFLESCGFKPCWTKEGAHVFSPHWWAYFQQFGKSRDKFIPQLLKESSCLELNALLMALMDGDGHWREKGISGTYYTISKRLADDVAEIALKLGKIVYVRSRVRKNRVGLSYSVSFKNTVSGGTELLTGNHVYSVRTQTKRRSDIIKKQYSGPVYCLGIKGTHTFVVRQNGSVWVSGNSYFKRNFIDGYKPYELHRAPEEDGGYLRQYIPARLDDNPSLDREQVFASMSGLPPALRDAILNGNWNAVVGAFYPEVDPEIHVVPPFRIPDHWPRFMAMDWGACGEGDPFSIGWWTVSDGTYLPRGSLVCYRRWYGAGLPKVTASQIATGIRQREGSEKIVSRWAGGDILEKRGHGESIFEIFAREGVHFQRADMRRINGWEQVRERLVGKNGNPLIYWTPETVEGLEMLGALQHDSNNPSDVGAGIDHEGDQIRYMCMARPFVRNKPPSELSMHEKFKIPTMDEAWKQLSTQKNNSRRI